MERETQQWNERRPTGETEPLRPMELNHTPREPFHPLKRANGSSEKIVPLPQRPATLPGHAQGYSQRREEDIQALPEDRTALILRVWREDPRRSDDAIAALTGIAKTTVWRKLKPYRDQERTREGQEPPVLTQGQAVQETLELPAGETAEPAS